MPRLADVLEQRSTDLLDMWRNQVEKWVTVRGLTPEQVMGSVPTYLAELTRALRDRASPLPADGVIEGHLAARLRQGFKLDEVVHEYTLLGECLSQVFSSSGGAQDIADVARFYAALNVAISTAVATFTRHMAEDEQTEKRYLRLFDQLAWEAAASGASLRHRGRQLIELIKDATSGDEALLVLLGTAEGELVTVGSSGVTDESARAWLNVLGLTAEEIREIPCTAGPRQCGPKREFTDVLRRGGAQAIIAQVLCGARGQLGVLCIGTATCRDFLPWERRRLSALSERLALLIENTDLLDEVQHHVSQLVSEQEMRETLVSVIAHDLRGPLNVAKLGADLLVRSPDRVQVLAGRVVRALGQVDQMVRDLLDTNRIRAGQQMSLQVVENLRLGALAKETAEQLASEYGKRFVVEVANDVVGAWSPDHVRRAIWNLATNAVKYGAPDTPVLITVGVSKAGYATLAVHNDGPPIRAEDAEHLFEPFRRAPAAPGRGWGLGLTLVRGVVEAHGGKVEVQSEPGKGTTFTLELPFRAHASPQPEGDLP